MKFDILIDYMSGELESRTIEADDIDEARTIVDTELLTSDVLDVTIFD
jgi:hypothetical protein